MKFFYFLLAFLLIANFFCLSFLFYLKSEKFLEVIFFDVGQGDGILIKTPYHQKIVIDGGASFSIIEKISKEIPFFDREIDLLILTHPEKDHIVGAIEILKKYKVKNVVTPKLRKETIYFKVWENLLQQKPENLYFVKRGNLILMAPLVTFVLNPKEIPKSQPENLNPYSLVFKTQFEKVSFLFTADIPISTQKEILKEKINLKSDVFKVPHHGSKFSLEKNFFEKVFPKIAVISVGRKNPYSHPHKETISFLEKLNCKILRTDLFGDVKIITDGKFLALKEF